jgi:hypothetical protein
MPIRITTLLLTAAAALLSAAGCSPQFQSDWKRTAAAEVPGQPPPDHLSGRWKGSWKSDKSGHSGGLRCIVTKTGDETYRANFNATYMALLRFSYSMDMTADVRDEETYVQGEEDLGKSYGGVYEYEGQADGKTFRINYKTNSDYGHFSLKRP